MNFDQKVKNFSFTILIFAIIAGGLFYFFNRPKRQPALIQAREEVNITIIPGWNLAQVAENWASVGLVSSTEEVFQILGAPAYLAKSQKLTANSLKDLIKNYPLLEQRPENKSYEGFLMPDTYRVYKDADLKDEVLTKIFENLENKITPEMRAEIKNQGKTFYEVLTMASVVEREARAEEDMKMVADIFWRRLKMNWALQSCATVNYITGKNVPAVSGEDKEIDSPYNTYKYPGLPPGPIGNPGLQAIEATIYPTKNNFWYFMSGTDGVTRYGRTLEEHNINVDKYLR